MVEDRSYVSTKGKLVIEISEFLKKLSLLVRPLVWLADSVYIVFASNKERAPAPRAKHEVGDDVQIFLTNG